MPVRILDLQHFYGVAGAREQFEKLVLALVESIHSSARTIQTKQGDGGIDIYVGPFTVPIDIYQAKYFPDELGPSQKNQIRNSFTRCKESTDFTMKSWTLCLPRDLTIDETDWFDGWKAKQSPIVETPWTAGKLETLLMKDENKGIKEHFFQQQHLTQIREIHEKLMAEPETPVKQPAIRTKAELLAGHTLTKFEREALLAASFAERTNIGYLGATGGCRIHIGGRILYSGPDSRELAAWRDALDNLTKSGSLKHPTQDSWTLTTKGFKTADAIRFTDFDDAAELGELTLEARSLLMEAANGGEISVMETLSDESVKIGNREFVTQKTSMAALQEGIRDMMRLRLIREDTTRGFYHATKKGKEVAEVLKLGKG